MKPAPLLALMALLAVATARAEPDADPADAGLADAAANEGDSGSVVDASPPIHEIVDDAIRALSRKRNAAGLWYTQRGRYPEALNAFREAHDLDRTDPEITENLGYLHQLLGNRFDAIRYYRETLRLSSRRRTALKNLAEVLAADGASAEALAEADDLLTRARRVKDNDPEIIRRQARIAARRGRYDDARKLYDEALTLDPADDALALELGDFHRDFGHPNEALIWYRRVREPEEALREAARRIRDVEIEREARRYGWSHSTVDVPEAARALATRARGQLSGGELGEALRLLQEAVRMAPTFTEAFIDLGDARRAYGDAQGAELAYLRALVTDASSAQAALRLGELYLATDRTVEGALFVSRALTLRPDWTHLHLELAQAWQAAGDLPRALHQVRLGLAALPEDAPDEELRALERTLTALLPATPVEPPPAEPGAEADPVAMAVARARAHLARSAPGEAMAELRNLAPDQRGVLVLNLEGQILRIAGQLDEAVASFTESLALDPEQAEIRAQRGTVRLALGQNAEGRADLEAAEVQGAALARLALARLDAASNESPEWLYDLARVGQLRGARDRLTALLASEEAERFRPEAEPLLERLDTRLRATYAVAAGAALLLLIFLGFGAQRVWGGADLLALIESHPETGPEVQRVLSAIRHEVLKHNTMVLTGLADALDQGDEAADKASWCRASLLGPPGEKAADAAIHRLRAYAEQLRQIGRAHGVRLNLTRRDAGLSALLRGFRLLEGLARPLDRVAVGARPGGRLRRGLRTATRLLNQEGYGAIRALLDRLRVLEVDAALLRAVFERTAREPQLATLDLAPLAVEAAEGTLPFRVAIPRAAFEDIVGNLMRNALQSTQRHGAAGQAIVIGVAIEDEVDFITGLSRAVVRIRDRSPQRLTPEMLRGRYIEEGLGLTADLVSRYDGTLDVEAEAAPWTKAVVLKLPRVEDEEEAS